MTEVETKQPLDSSDQLTGANLPATIEPQDCIKKVYIEEIYTGEPGLIIILSQRFNELAQENSVTPDFSALTEIGFEVALEEFSISSRTIVRDLNRKAVRDKRKVITLKSDNGQELIEDLALKGFENTLLPIVADIESNMEEQLEAEIARLQKLKRSGGPK